MKLNFYKKHPSPDGMHSGFISVSETTWFVFLTRQKHHEFNGAIKKPGSILCMRWMHMGYDTSVHNIVYFTKKEHMLNLLTDAYGTKYEEDSD